MKRTRRWLLMFAALIGFMAIHVNGLRATSLFGRGSTTTKTTTTTTEAPSEDDVEVTESTTLETTTNSTNSTSSKLTGIPQIDYVWDPNLPRELNGFNLSDYPFLNSVPPEDEIEFKCNDELHDGFYASIKYNCQLYHHCISGVRYDFLCANFTSFDQKTFICTFVSDVDCKNSAKYWFRNDALYWETTTTTTTTTTPAPTTVPPPKPIQRPRRPLRRRRPQVDYYYDDEYLEDEYEEPLPRRRKQRPRNRRPEYDDYRDDDRYNRREPAYSTERGRNRQEDDDYVYDNRRPVNDRTRTRSKPNDNRRYNDDVENKRKPTTNVREYEDRRTYDDDKRYSSDKRFNTDDRRFSNDRRNAYDERRPIDGDRRPTDEDRRPTIKDDRRPAVIDDERTPAVANDRRKPYDDRRPVYDDPPPPPPPPRRPYRDDYDDERPAKRPAIKNEPEVEEAPKVKPTSTGTGSIFDRPRAPPRIRRPVPINERNKYEYSTSKPVQTQSSGSLEDSEYYDDYEEAPPAPPPVRPKTIIDNKRPNRPDSPNKRENVKRPEPVEPKRPITRDEEYYEDEYEERPQKSVPKPQNIREIIKDDSDNNPKVNRGNYRDKVSAPRDPFRPPAVRYSPINPTFNDDSTEIRQTQSSQVSKQNVQSDRDRDIDPNYSNFKQSKPQQQIPQQQQKDFYKSGQQIRVDPVIPKRDERDPYSLRPNDRDQYTVFDREPINNREEISFKGFNSDNRRTPAVSIRTPYDFPMNRPTTTASSEEDIRIREVRPIIRVVKRPFLPSRGGSPYLPRGLQPVGTQSETSKPSKDLKSEQEQLKHEQEKEIKEYTELEKEEEHLNQPTGPNKYFQQEQSQRPTQKPTQSPPTQPPQQQQYNHQNDLPKATLDEIYDSEYDVTLNDALNPTLKPLAPSRGSPIGFSIANKFERSRLVPYTPTELKFSPSQIRRTAIRPPQRQTPVQHYNSRTPISDLEFYDDYDY